jgi:hypothetical protein
MPKKVNWTMSVQVIGGASISESKSFDAEILVDGDVIVPGNGKKTIGVASTDIKNIRLLMMAADNADPTNPLTFLMHNGSAPENPKIALDKPLMLLGSAVLRMLLATPTGTPTPPVPLGSIEFNNPSPNDVSVHVLICGNASSS